MKFLIILSLLLVASCAGTDERGYSSEDYRVLKAEEFVSFASDCKEMGGKIVIRHKQSTRIKRAYTWEEMQTAVCQI